MWKKPFSASLLAEPGDTFLDQTTLGILREVFEEKLGLRGTLIIQTQSTGILPVLSEDNIAPRTARLTPPTEPRRTALAIGKNMAKLTHARGELDRAYQMLSSSYLVSNTRSVFPTGIREVSHSSWAINIRCSKGYIWICFQPQRGAKKSKLSEELERINPGLSHFEFCGLLGGIVLLHFLVIDLRDKILFREFRTLMQYICARQGSTGKTSHCDNITYRVVRWSRAILKQESIMAMRQRIEKEIAETDAKKASTRATEVARANAEESTPGNTWQHVKHEVYEKSEMPGPAEKEQKLAETTGPLLGMPAAKSYSDYHPIML